MYHRLASLVARILSSPALHKNTISLPTNLTASLASLTSLLMLSSTATPAADKIFGTVELVEAILAELPLEDLLVAMCTCKSFCAIIKTSKVVMRDKYWMSMESGADESEKNSTNMGVERVPAEQMEEGDDGDGDDDDEQRAAFDKRVREFGGMFELDLGSDSDEEDYGDSYNAKDRPHLVITPSSRTCVNFMPFQSIWKNHLMIQMADHKRTGNIKEACAADNRICLVNRASNYSHQLDTDINICSNQSTELWRRVPLAAAPEGVEVVLRARRGAKLSCKLFGWGSTLGDLYVWLGDEVAASENPQYERPGQWYLSRKRVVARDADRIEEDMD